MGRRGSGRVSDGAYVDIGPLHAPPRADDATAGARRRREPSSATATRSGATSPAGARCACSSTRRPAGRGVGRAIGRDAGRRGRGPLAAPASRSRWRSGSTEATIAEAAGFRPDLVIELNRTDPRTIPDALLDAVAGRGRGRPRATPWWPTTCPCPSDELARDFIHARHVMNDAPRYEGEAEATYTVEELLAVEAASVAAHQGGGTSACATMRPGSWSASARCTSRPSGPGSSSRATPACDPTHRGHGLGAWMKAVNHLRLRDERPEVEIVQTWNASSNEPMLRINRALGFAPVQRFQGWYLPLG